jgi:hypothetical protein
MHPRTKATLEELETANWFSQVGTMYGVKQSCEVIILASWQEAIEQCSSIEWENASLEAQNQYCERLGKRSTERFNQWNEVAVMLKAITIPFVQHKIEAVVGQNNLPTVFENMVQWDILGVCLESEFADLYPPGFFTSNAYWYTKGHFPCGWQGDFPQGKLMIY